jgi:hypothetical protein
MWFGVAEELSGLSSPDCFLLPALPVAISSTAAGAFDLLTLGAKLSASRDYNSGAATALRWNVCPLAAVYVPLDGFQFPPAERAFWRHLQNIKAASISKAHPNLRGERPTSRRSAFGQHR